MRRGALAGAVVLAVVAVVAETSWSQPGEGLPEGRAVDSEVLPPGVGLPQPPTVDVAPAGQATAEPDEAAELRRRLTDLATRRAAVMTAAELREAVGEAERALEEQTARAELRRAVQILETLVLEHPETHAAKEAQRALEELGTPTSKSSPFALPVPVYSDPNDPQFDGPPFHRSSN